MNRAQRYERVVEWFSKAMPVAEPELHYGNAFQLLVAVILSAQCTDRRVNMVTPRLFEDYPFGGEVPSEGKDLERLPGVGRKTANVIQAVIFGKARMAVDTHVFRVSHRIGLVPESASTPLAVERILTKHFPEELIPKAHHWLILHGRYTCTARNPKCESCGLNTICNYAKNHHS